MVDTRDSAVLNRLFREFIKFKENFEEFQEIVYEKFDEQSDQNWNFTTENAAESARLKQLRKKRIRSKTGGMMVASDDEIRIEFLAFLGLYDSAVFDME